MEKKNPFITTIGFKKDDPEHIYVAELLNSLGRGKAQYIVKAILAYQSNMSGEGTGAMRVVGLDYNAVRRIVLQVLEEQGKQYEGVTVSKPEQEEMNEIMESDYLQNFDNDAIDGIMAAMAAFQEE